MNYCKNCKYMNRNFTGKMVCSHKGNISECNITGFLIRRDTIKDYRANYCKGEFYKKDYRFLVGLITIISILAMFALIIK